MQVPKILHYTQLKKGDQYLMASGNIAHLIGTEILGTASFLFAFDNYKRLELIYPGVPGCKDHPILNFKDITSIVDTDLVVLRAQKLKDAITKVHSAFDCPNALRDDIYV